jgi:cytochrome d ubiquinol oxidase subunit II
LAADFPGAGDRCARGGVRDAGARALAARVAASSLFIVGLLTTMAAGIYPNVLPARDDHPFGLTLHNGAAGHHTLMTAAVWWPIGMVLAGVYFVFAYRMFFSSQNPPKLGTSEPRQSAP